MLPTGKTENQKAQSDTLVFPRYNPEVYWKGTRKGMIVQTISTRYSREYACPHDRLYLFPDVPILLIEHLSNIFAWKKIVNGSSHLDGAPANVTNQNARL